MSDNQSSAILITGSSGYVASDLIPRIKENWTVKGLDLRPSKNTDFIGDIAGKKTQLFLKNFDCDQLIVVNLAAARFDFGKTAEEYYQLNVVCHQNFLDALDVCKVAKFIHVSSVASLDGRHIQYSQELDCDDAYRSTKFLQEQLIQNWCKLNGVELAIVYPSAIFSRDARSDTNIGKLQYMSRFLPVIPRIDVVKSLTYLPHFSTFIVKLISGRLGSGKYLAIERPSLTVSRVIQVLSGRPVYILHFPFLEVIVKSVAKVLYFIGGFGQVDLGLTPNRVAKLFSDTSYSDLSDDDINLQAYGAESSSSLTELLLEVAEKRS